VRDLTPTSGNVVIVVTRPSPSGFRGANVKIESTVGGTVVGYALKCSGDPQSSSCSLWQDKFADKVPHLKGPDLQAGEWIMLVLLTDGAVPPSMNLHRLFQLEVL